MMGGSLWLITSMENPCTADHTCMAFASLSSGPAAAETRLASCSQAATLAACSRSDDRGAATPNINWSTAGLSRAKAT